MENRIRVNGKQSFLGREIPVIEGGFGEGKRCLTDKTIAEIHGMKTIHVRELINKNTNRFKDSVDFIDIKRIDMDDTLRSLDYAKQSITQAKHIYLLSERGYAKLIKIMDNDKAWEIHDELIDGYFNMRKVINSLEQQKAMALLNVLEGRTVEDRMNGINVYTRIKVEEETKPLIETIEIQAPKAEVYDNFIDKQATYGFREIRKEIESALNITLKENQFKDILKAIGLIGTKGVKALAFAIRNEYMVTKDVSCKDFVRTQDRFTMKGREYILDYFKKNKLPEKI